MMLDQSIETLKGVGPSLAKQLKKLGVENIEDLLLYYPKKYQDYANITSVNKLTPGIVSIKAKIKQIKGRWIRGGLHITEAVASDDTSSVRIVWFNQPYREKAIKKGEDYFISGTLELSHRKYAIMNPSMELVSSFPVNTARIIPIYREHKEIKSSEIRKALRTAFQSVKTVESSIPPDIQKEYNLIDKTKALRLIHFPKTTQDLSRAKRRLGFEEVFELMVANELLKRETLSQNALPVEFDAQLAKKFVQSLPFKLTDGQRAAAWEIYQDMSKAHPMNRLLEGDVGAGKTVVAAMTAAMAVERGFQVALMAPTELLARQHADTLVGLLKPLGYDSHVLLLVGSMNSAQKQKAHLAVTENRAKFIVGTHALIQEKVNMRALAMVIVDEQHRFGVDQRKALLKKANHMPHMLSMTATPIPRSLALTVCGDLDISILRHKPKSRKPLITENVRPSDRQELYKKIDKLLDRKQQMFVVCPLISQSDLMPAVSVDEAAEEVKKAFPEHTIAILHGKQTPNDKQKTMESFVAGKIDILVSTTVIEVGVDVPNATIMLIESPERFGLAQIHQLRGRVGRGSQQGYCYLLLSEDKPPTKRLRAISQSQDGFRLAELDLDLRGPGAIYGSRQHGDLDLRLVTLSDTSLIKEAREAAYVAAKKPDNLLQYERLAKRIRDLQKINHLN